MWRGRWVLELRGRGSLQMCWLGEPTEEGDKACPGLCSYKLDNERCLARKLRRSSQ